jgi:hypothetical protein
LGQSRTLSSSRKQLLKLDLAFGVDRFPHVPRAAMVTRGDSFSIGIIPKKDICRAMPSDALASICCCGSRGVIHLRAVDEGHLAKVVV